MLIYQSKIGFVEAKNKLLKRYIIHWTLQINNVKFLSTAFCRNKFEKDYILTDKN